jgi:alkaline phosphatase D
VFQKVPDAPNLAPSAGLQFFGHVTVAGASGVMTVRLRDLTGATLWSIDLDPA